MDPVTGSIISAGISGIGSLLGGKSEAKRAASAASAASDRSDLQAREANMFNMNMAREANQFTQAERREQNEWNAAQVAAMNDYNNPANQRKLAEAAGFNPLIFAGAGTALQGAAAAGGSGQGAVGGAAAAQSYQPQQVSSGIADAFSAFGSGFADYAASKSEATLLRQQNDELRKTLTKSILRPAVGGIYGGGDVPLEQLGGVKNPRLPSGSRLASALTKEQQKEKEDAMAASDKGNAPPTKKGKIFGLDISRSGWTSDGDFWSTAGGEPMEWATAPFVLADIAGATGADYAGRATDAFKQWWNNGGPTMKIGGKRYMMSNPKMSVKRSPTIPNSSRGQKKYPYEILKDNR